jgi:hypothetical protein
MAIQTRYAGDSNGINNVDAKYDGTLGTIVATGLTKNPIALVILPGKSQTFSSVDSATGNSVETILRAIELDSTITMYQVNSDRLSVLLEATGAGGTVGTSTSEGAATVTASTIASALQTRIQAIVGTDGAGNISATSGNIWANATTVSGTYGFKLANS